MGVTWALHTNTHKFYRILKGQHCPMTWRISCDGLLNMMMIFRSYLAALGLKWHNPPQKKHSSQHYQAANSGNWMISPLSWVSYISHQVNLDWRILLQTIAGRISFGICLFTQEPQKRAARNYISTSMDSLPTNLTEKHNLRPQSRPAATKFKAWSMERSLNQNLTFHSCPIFGISPLPKGH